MKRWASATAGLLTFLSPAVAMAIDEGVPLPRGWIGTANDWVRGFGIAFALLNLVLLCFAGRGVAAPPGASLTPRLIAGPRGC